MVDLSMTVVVIAAFVFVSTQAHLSNVHARGLLVTSRANSGLVPRLRLVCKLININLI